MVGVVVIADVDVGAFLLLSILIVSESVGVVGIRVLGDSASSVRIGAPIASPSPVRNLKSSISWIVTRCSPTPSFVAS